MIELRYFAWVRERIGFASETYDGDAATVSALLDELEARGENYQAAFADRDILRVALDQEITHDNPSLQNVKEVAIFPPMTGG